MVGENYLPLATLIPVLNRPQNVEPLITSFKQSRTPGLIVFIANIEDIDELIALNANLYNEMRIIQVVDAHTWPQKINVGVEQVEADWYLCAADDIYFHRGWWKATSTLRADKTVGVIGTNDMGNPRVIAGEHTTHPLIRRQYIMQQGTYDQPGVAIHEGYKHWYCDDELVITAKMRDAWAFCPEARIQHMHPYWNPETPVDDTYRLGESSSEQDQQTFISRLQTMGFKVETR